MLVRGFQPKYIIKYGFFLHNFMLNHRKYIYISTSSYFSTFYFLEISVAFWINRRKILKTSNFTMENFGQFPL